MKYAFRLLHTSKEPIEIDLGQESVTFSVQVAHIYFDDKKQRTVVTMNEPFKILKTIYGVKVTKI